MSELKIPDEAYSAVWDVVGGCSSNVVEALQATAPLIVAAELRQLAKEQLKTHDDISCMSLLRRADELDPQGLTKE
jgi:hypothetical protein